MFARTVFGLSLFSGLALGAVHQVTVGGVHGETIFEPPFVYANPQDTVVFTFNPKNHTVSQSTFGNPCLQKPDGFDSGFNFPVKVGTSNSARPQYNITVPDYTPIWLRCRQGEFTANSDCGRGMVFAINPGPEGSAWSYEQFQVNALAQAALLAQLIPAPAPAAAAPPATSSAPASTSAPAPTSAAPTTTATSAVAASTPSTTPAVLSPVSFVPSPLKTVYVGVNGTFTYSPSALTAVPGDKVRFIFNSSTHTVTQSSFNTPCLPLKGGFNSGLHAVSPSDTSLNYYDIEVFTTDPVFIYSAQAGDCGQGMVMTINANESSSQSTVAFTARAIALNETQSGPSTAVAGAAGARRRAASLGIAGRVLLA